MKKVFGAVVGSLFLALVGACGAGDPSDPSDPADSLSGESLNVEAEQTSEISSELASGECRSICTATTPCNTACTVNAAQIVNTTCGGSGMACRQCGWREVGRQIIGRNQGGLPPLYCRYWVTALVTTEDTCTGARTTKCEHYVDGAGFNMDCCQAWGCGGVDHC